VPGDADCDHEVSAADVPALLQLLATGAFGPCGRADANQDGKVSTADIPALIDAIFDAP